MRVTLNACYRCQFSRIPYYLINLLATMTSNRRLARMPPHLALTAGQLAKLALYPNGGIRTTRELLEKSKIELVENCDLDGEVVEDIKRKVSRWIAPKSVTVNIL